MPRCLLFVFSAARLILKAPLFKTRLTNTLAPPILAPTASIYEDTTTLIHGHDLYVVSNMAICLGEWNAVRPQIADFGYFHLVGTGRCVY
mgnify:CR=1 FL=1